MYSDLIGLAVAARLFNTIRPNGKPVHPATLNRWITAGTRRPDGTRLRLRALRVGSKWLTREEWLDEYAAANTAAHNPAATDDAASAPRSPAQRKADTDAALARLETMGV